MSSSPAARRPVREEILDAALRLIGERGLHAVTHRDVAAAAGVSPGSTTYHFQTLEGLLTAALERFVERELARVEGVAAELEATAASQEAVVAAMAAQIDLTLADPNAQVAQYELYLEATRRPALRAAAARCLEAYRRVAEAALRAAGDEDPEALAPVVLALVDGLMLQQLADPQPAYAERVLKPALRRLLDP